MILQTYYTSCFDADEVDMVQLALARAAQRLDNWQHKGHPERIAMLAKVADQLLDKPDKLSSLISGEIIKLLTQAAQEINSM